MRTCQEVAVGLELLGGKSWISKIGMQKKTECVAIERFEQSKLYVDDAYECVGSNNRRE